MRSGSRSKGALSRKHVICLIGLVSVMGGMGPGKVARASGRTLKAPYSTTFIGGQCTPGLAATCSGPETAVADAGSGRMAVRLDQGSPAGGLAPGASNAWSIVTFLALYQLESPETEALSVTAHLRFDVAETHRDTGIHGDGSPLGEGDGYLAISLYAVSEACSRCSGAAARLIVAESGVDRDVGTMLHDIDRSVTARISNCGSDGSIPPGTIDVYVSVSMAQTLDVGMVPDSGSMLTQAHAALSDVSIQDAPSLGCT